MTSEESRNELFRAEALQTYDEYVALLVLAHEVRPKIYAGIAETREFLATAARRAVRPFLNEVKSEIRRLRKSLHVRGEGTVLREILQEMEADGRDVYYLQKGFLDTIIDLNRLQPAYKQLPLYSWVGFSLKWETDLKIPEFFLLEAKLYEDMCSLFNMSKEAFATSTGEVLGTLTTVVPRKARDALLRATFVATFEFVESYLNGLATEYLFTHHVDEKTTAFLSERPRYIGFRDKLIHYPRIYAEREHPFFQETNSEEVKILVARAADRSAFVHPSALPLDETLTSKEHAFFRVKLEAVTEVVDAAVSYVLKVEKAIGRDSVISEWIVPRAADGFFPAKSFE